MEEQFFYLQGYQPKGGKRLLAIIVWIFMLVVLITILSAILINKGSIESHHYLYIFIIILWLVATPIIKPKGILLLPKDRELKLISLVGKVKIGGAKFNKIVSIEPVEKTTHKVVLTLIDGTKKNLSIEERDKFIHSFEEIKSRINNENKD